MAGTRTVYRGSKGRFAGASAGKAEKVRSGGFANAAFRARIASAPRASRGASPQGRLAKGSNSSRTTRKSTLTRIVGRPGSAQRRKFTMRVAQGAGIVAAGAVIASATPRQAKKPTIMHKAGLQSAKNSAGRSVIAPRHMSKTNASALGLVKG